MTLDNPFIGPKSYSDGDAFYGRERETDELYNLIRNETLTLLFSRSGAGKSSLLKAGIIPKLRSGLEFLPVYIHLNASDTVNIHDSSLSVYVIKECTKEIKKLNSEVFDYKFPNITIPGSLFEFIHGLEISQIEKLDDGMTNTFKVKPLLIFDQFEEIFTQPFKIDQLDFLYNEIRYLIENEVPVYLKEAFDNSENNDILKLKSILKSKQKDYRVLFAFREEYLPQFESLKKKIPSIKFTNGRLRLEPFSVDTAEEIICKTAPNISKRDAAVISTSLAAKIIGFDQQMVDPFLLSVICMGIYPDITGGKEVSAIEIKSLVNNSLGNYLKNVYSDISEQTKKFIEQRLITSDGTRNYVNYLDIKNKDYAGNIDKLINDQDYRLLSKGQFLESEQVSILHDRLLPPLLEFKNKREEKEKRIAVAKVIGIAIIAAVVSIVVWSSHTHEDEIKTVNRNLEKAQELIDYDQNFLSAYSFIKAVNMSTISMPDTTDRKKRLLGTTLLFHLITPRIEINNELVIYRDIDKIMVNKVTDFKNHSSLLLDSTATNFGFSTNTPQYWVSYNKSAVKKGNIINYKIDENLHMLPVAVDSTFTPTADYDGSGNLYYFKNNSIWIDRNIENSKPGFFIKISPLNIRADQSIELKFIPKEDNTPSDFLRISVKNCSCTQIDVDPTLTFIINIKSKKQKKIPQGIGFYVNKNKNVYYTKLSQDSISMYSLVLDTDKLGRDLPDNLIPTVHHNGQHVDFVNELINKGLIKVSSQPNATFLSPKGIFSLSYDHNKPNELKINKNGTPSDTVLFNKTDSIVTFKPLGNYFTLLHQKKKDPKSEQLVIFETYDKSQKQEFHIPKNWNFSYFKDSIMVFRYIGYKSNQIGILVMNYEMTKDNWLNRHRLLDSLMMIKDSLVINSKSREDKKGKNIHKKANTSKTKSQLITFCSK
jgi:hypothetical protein